jgi:hypothetical protein
MDGMGKREDWLFGFAVIGALAGVVKILEYFKITPPQWEWLVLTPLEWAIGLCALSLALFGLGVLARKARQNASPLGTIVLPGTLPPPTTDGWSVPPGGPLHVTATKTNLQRDKNAPADGCALIDSGGKGTYVIDRQVETFLGLGKLLRFYARMPDEGQKVYTLVRVKNRSGATKAHWIEHVHGTGKVRPDERREDEHRFYMTGTKEQFGFSRFEIDLAKEVKRIPELKTFLYAQLLAIRLRTGHEEGSGALAISPFRIY